MSFGGRIHACIGPSPRISGSRTGTEWLIIALYRASVVVCTTCGVFFLDFCGLRPLLVILLTFIERCSVNRRKRQVRGAARLVFTTLLALPLKSPCAYAFPPTLDPPPSLSRSSYTKHPLHEAHRNCLCASVSVHAPPQCIVYRASSGVFTLERTFHQNRPSLQSPHAKSPRTTPEHPGYRVSNRTSTLLHFPSPSAANGHSFLAAGMVARTPSSPWLLLRCSSLSTAARSTLR